MKLAVTVAEQTYVYDSAVEGIPDYRLPMHELRALGTAALARVLGDTAAAEAVEMLASIDGVADVGSALALLVPDRVGQAR